MNGLHIVAGFDSIILYRKSIWAISKIQGTTSNFYFHRVPLNPNYIIESSFMSLNLRKILMDALSTFMSQHIQFRRDPLDRYDNLAFWFACKVQWNMFYNFWAQ
jgi:hypothetical protein